MKSIRFHPDARFQLRQSIRHYADAEAALGHRFQAAVDRAPGAIRSNPETYVCEREFRLKSVQPFRHWLVFVPRSECIWIIAVHHERQDDSYWQNRLAAIDQD